VTKWLGNTPSVALRHYVDPTEAAFDRAVNWVPGGESGAKSGARGAQKAPQQADAGKHRKSQKAGGNVEGEAVSTSPVRQSTISCHLLYK
jgi:hypothetical protein